MKKTYLILAGAFAFLGVIFAFENIIMIAPVIILFKQMNASLFFPMFLMLIIGIGCGLFLGLAMGAKKESYDDEF